MGVGVNSTIYNGFTDRTRYKVKDVLNAWITYTGVLIRQQANRK